MYCRNCANEVSDKAVMCVSCGTPPISGNKYCHNCKAETAPTAIFCLKCGVGFKKQAMTASAIVNGVNIFGVISSGVMLVTAFLPWFKISSEASFMGYSTSLSSGSISGFQIADGLIVLFLSIAAIFLSLKNIKWVAAIGAINLIIAIRWMVGLASYNTSASFSSSYGSASSSIHVQYGIYLLCLASLALIISTGKNIMSMLLGANSAASDNGSINENQTMSRQRFQLEKSKSQDTNNIGANIPADSFMSKGKAGRNPGSLVLVVIVVILVAALSVIGTLYFTQKKSDTQQTITHEYKPDPNPQVTTNNSKPSSEAGSDIANVTERITYHLGKTSFTVDFSEGKVYYAKGSGYTNIRLSPYNAPNEIIYDEYNSSGQMTGKYSFNDNSLESGVFIRSKDNKVFRFSKN